MNQDNQAKPALIRVDNVTKSYRMGQDMVAVLHGVSLEIEAGRFSALIGPSGSGKSTLLNICGLIDGVDSGQVILDGKSVSDLPQRELTLIRREKIGFVFQGFNLVPVMTAFENVEYPLFLSGMAAKARKSCVNEMLDSVGLAGLEHRRPDELSGGQKQRVAIARALVKNPKLVIADEPTANLDSNTATQIIKLMHNLGRSNGTTFMFATHDARMTGECDRVIDLHDGRLQ
jgi:putative ABC transport system ATP-binding protein